MPTLFGLILVVAALFLSSIPTQADFDSSQVLGSSQVATTSANLNPIKTQSLFKSQIFEKVQILAKRITYQDDPQTEAGITTILDEGVDGKKTTTIKLTYVRKPDLSDLCQNPLSDPTAHCEDGTYYQEYDREVVNTDVKEPKDKLISRGTKIIWRTFNSSDGQISYWEKLHVWATHYDSHCLGCDEWTATGLHQGKGVIAVDPRVIKLGSKVYVPGYGFAIAGDTGGAIKGNVIDLGFPDARTAGWWAHFVDIYILN